MELMHANVLGAGTPMLILHGFLGMSDNWKSLGSKYAEKGFQVHLLDQRNHGRSFWSDDFNYHLLAEDLKAYMDARGISAGILLGHSMGGKTAMQMACLYPEYVSRLIVADIAPKRYPPHHKEILDGLTAVSYSLPELKSRNEADKLLSKYLDNEGIRQFLLKNLYWERPGKLGLRINLEILKNKMEHIGASLQTGAKYGGAVLFLRGGNSGYVSMADLPLIHEHFPNSRMETVEGAGHWLHAEKPEAFLRASLNFIKS